METVLRDSAPDDNAVERRAAMERRKVLIINEDACLSSELAELLPEFGYINRIELSCKRGVAWLADGNTPALTLLNIQTGSAALTVLKSIREVAPTAPVLVIGSVHELRLIVEALKLGASDYLTVPFDKAQACLTMQTLVKDQRKEQVTPANADPLLQCSFSNPAMAEAFEIAKIVAPSDVPVLITGESGVGKDVFARFIHSQSRRAGRSVIKINCAALPHDLLESEMFGHERGAFTGADTQKLGKFELAHGGTIFLDEIGEMSPLLQAKLLHVLQDGEFCRLGGRRPIQVDARVIASTNRNLEEAVSRGDFREDLYFRLNVIRINVPPLRERRDEIEFLCDYFVKKYAKQFLSPVEKLPPDVLGTFVAADWPGNIRQLENAVKRYLIIPRNKFSLKDLKAVPLRPPVSTDDTVDARPQKVVPVATTGTTAAHDPAEMPHLPSGEFESLKQVSTLAAERAEREVVLWMLTQTNWNRKLTARRLNVCYKALLNRIKKWQLRRPPSTRLSGRVREKHTSAVLATHFPGMPAIPFDPSAQQNERAV